MAEKSVDNLLLAIEDSKNISFEKVLFGLGIRHVGETVAKLLAKRFINIESIIEADFETLVAVDEIGEKIAESLVYWFSIQKNIDLINSLRSCGVKFNSTIQNVQLSDKLKEMRIVISGTFQKYSRIELKKMIENHGGENVSSISKNTTFVIAGENMGPNKKVKAKALEISIINEEEFLSRIN
jgi:DNA ligase (NAD+)